MRTVFVFPGTGREETAALLDRHLPRSGGTWVMPDVLYAHIDDEPAGLLFRDWEPEEVARIDAALGRHPDWALQVDVSRRVEGAAELLPLLALLLEHGGVAADDHSPHAWTLREIEDGTVVDGLRFFGSRAGEDSSDEGPR
ncbi:hypothetical protein ABZ249_14200 [Nocardiopsis sp. NPDC006139]|uniref:hypothetical protein n=1 Tax=unclassified Nocardiopsis TaxID=2649073 RepID=UPI0033AA6599